MREDIYKPQFVCIGSEDDYKVKFLKVSSDVLAEINSSGSIHYIIVLDTYRIDSYFKNPIQMISYAKRTIWAKGRGAYSEGRAKIFVIDENTRKEVQIATVEKIVTRRYAPVERRRKK
jgi:hypothetical protein